MDSFHSLALEGDDEYEEFCNAASKGKYSG